MLGLMLLAGLAIFVSLAFFVAWLVSKISRAFSWSKITRRVLYFITLTTMLLWPFWDYPLYSYYFSTKVPQECGQKLYGQAKVDGYLIKKRGSISMYQLEPLFKNNYKYIETYGRKRLSSTEYQDSNKYFVYRILKRGDPGCIELEKVERIRAKRNGLDDDHCISVQTSDRSISSHALTNRSYEQESFLGDLLPYTRDTTEVVDIQAGRVLGRFTTFYGRSWLKRKMYPLGSNWRCDGKPESSYELVHKVLLTHAKDNG